MLTLYWVNIITALRLKTYETYYLKNKKIMKPTKKAPNLKLNLINDTQWELEKQKPENFTLLVFYRGLHCPVCKKQLQDLRDNLTKFSDIGVNILALSMDTEKRAKTSRDEWETGDLPIAYGLTEKEARSWNLFISSAISEKEPERFSEPALYLIDKEQNIIFSQVQSMPFARPTTESILKGIEFIINKDYPSRGRE